MPSRPLLRLWPMLQSCVPILENQLGAELELEFGYLTGDLNRALFWYRTEPLSVFGYKTAERLVSEGRTDDVLRYVTSLEADTAVREYQRLSPLMPPGTLVSYTVNAQAVVDLRRGYDSTPWPPLWEEFYCEWRDLWFNQRVEPPSWVLADEAMAAGATGILFASRIAPGGVNLVLYNETLDAGDALTVYDPAGALPKNQDSWR